MKLILDTEVTAFIGTHGEAAYPNECCGFLYGEDGAERHITYVQKVANTQEGNQQRRFKIDPKDYQKAEKYASENNLDLLGIYHTHPDHPAEPSEHDRKVAMPFFSYVIVSVEDGKATDVRSWRLNDQRQFEEEPVKIQQLINDESV